MWAIFASSFRGNEEIFKFPLVHICFCSFCCQSYDELWLVLLSHDPTLSLSLAHSLYLIELYAQLMFFQNISIDCNLANIRVCMMKEISSKLDLHVNYCNDQ